MTKQQVIELLHARGWTEQQIQDWKTQGNEIMTMPDGPEKLKLFLDFLFKTFGSNSTSITVGDREIDLPRIH